MNESILERIQSSAKALKIDLYTAELASYADEKELTPDVRGKVILQPHGKEFFTYPGKQIFTS